MFGLLKNLVIPSVIACALVVGGGVSKISAQEKLPQAVAAVIDVTQILNVSEAWKNAEKSMKSRVDEVQKTINDKNESLKTKASELQRQQTILAPDVYQQKASEIQKQQRALQREAQVSNAKVNEVLNKVRLQLRGVIIQIAAKVAQEKGMNIGFDRSSVVFFNDAMDISGEVLKRFNASKTKVEITTGNEKKN